MPIGQLLPCRLKALVVHEVILQGEILQCKNIFATHPLPRGYLKDCHCEPLCTPLQRSSVSVNAGFHHRHLNEGQKRLFLFSFCPQRPSSTAYPRVIQIDRRHPDRHVRVRVVSRQ